MSNTKKFTIEESQWVGEQIGADWNKYSTEQLRNGLDVEMEHGKINPATNVTNDDLILTAKIALTHLNEFPDYYVRLEIMEKEAKGYWKNRSRINYN